MIEDKELGLKVTENEEETYWQKAKDESDVTIKRLESALKFESAVNEMIKSKLEEINNGTSK